MPALTDQLSLYLRAQHIPSVFPAADLATLIQYNLSQRTGDYTTRFQAMLAAAAAFVATVLADEPPEERSPLNGHHHRVRRRPRGQTRRGDPHAR